MEDGWGNLCKVEKMFEKGRKRKAEPDIKLLLAKNDSIKGLLLGWHGTVIHQTNNNPAQHIEALPKLLCSKEFDELLLIHPFNAFSWFDVFLAFTNLTGKSSTPLWWHAEAMGRVRPARHNDRMLWGSHLALLLVSNTLVMQGITNTSSKPICEQSPSSTCRADPILGSPPLTIPHNRSWPN